MTAPFIDTNILLYAKSNAVADEPERLVASGLLTRVAPSHDAQSRRCTRGLVRRLSAIRETKNINSGMSV